MQAEAGLATLQTSPQDLMGQSSGGMGRVLKLVSRPKTDSAQKEVLAYVTRIFEQSKKERINFERQWYINLAFYAGKHHVQWINTSSGNYSKLVEPAMPPWRVRLVVNKIRVQMRHEMAKLLKEKPRGFVIPKTSDDSDIMAARAGDDILNHLHRELKLEAMKRAMVFWLSSCGNSFFKDWYDTEKPDSSGMQGSIMLQVANPFAIYVVDLMEPEIEGQPAVFHTTGKDPEYLEGVYGVKLIPDANSSQGEVNDKLLSALNLLQTANKSYVNVMEGWIKPCKKFANGAMVTWSQGKLLNVQEEWPWGYSDYPFTKFDHVPTGRFYSVSPIEDLIPLQKEYNRTRSQIIESKNRMSKPQLLAQEGSVDVSKITSEPGLVIKYAIGAPVPTPLQLQNLPPYVIQDLQLTAQDMADISSQHEMSRGQAPTGVTAATAITFLQEEDDSKLAFTIASIEEGIEKINRHFLQHVVDRWAAERQIEVVGYNKQVETSVFSSTSLDGNVNWVVESGSAIPRSRAAKQAFIMELMQLGYLPPEKGLQYLDMAETGRIYEEMQLDARLAQRENMYMKSGILQVPPNTFDNHLQHIVEHDNFRKRELYEQMDPQVKAALEQHVQGHKLYLVMAYGRYDLFDSASQQLLPTVEGFIMQLMSGQPPTPPPAQTQSSVQDAGQAQ